jgi:MobA/MobL family
MSHYHLSAHDVITRSKGDKVVRVAAYAAREKLRDERYGQTHNFTKRRHELLYSTMLPPDLGPAWTRDRQDFWNAVEDAENRKNSQLAIPYDIALPHELTLEQNIALITAYCQKEFVSRGLVVDLNLHQPDPDKDQRNIHAHILIPTRPIDENGFTKKQRTANSRKSWVQERTENIKRLRESWAHTHNLHMDAAGFDSSHHIDHRSYAEQGIRLEPTTHRGVATDNMEKRGLTTDRGDDYRNIQAENEKRALRKRKRKDYAEPSEASTMPDAQSEAQKIAAEAIRKEAERQDQARKDQDKLQEALIAEDEHLKELGRKYLEHRDRLVQQAKELEALNKKILQEIEDRFQKQNPFESYVNEVGRAVQDKREEITENRDRRYLEGDIRDSGTRYSQALHQHYDSGDPYQSLAKAAMAEHASFRTDQALLSEQIAKTADPKAREALEIRRKIEGYEYLMITGERIAVQSELITGRLNSEEAAKMRAAVRGEIIKDKKRNKIAFPGYTQEAENLRFDYRNLQAERSAPAKEHAPTPSALDKIVADAKRETPAPSRTRRPRRDYKDRLQQQERERKAQQDRDRER